ncbi:uncharacterized protein LOC143563998 [Bidens hawaiensis]|uniref:uncharacterized protein LOC143563998 n=1 Tax=Bidens hawaiensis TaxID=980011 RepID=UPI00404A4EC7
MLKVSPWDGIIHFRKSGKLSSRYIGPFNILAHIGEVAYRLDLPAEPGGIHSTFHVSHLTKCLVDDTSHLQLMGIEVEERLNYIEKLVEIVDRKDKQLRHKVIPLVKVIRKHRKGSDAT